MAQKTKFGIVAGLAGAALMMSAAPTWAATTVDLNNSGDISNPGFEAGTSNPGATGWTLCCNTNPTGGVYTPGSSNYTVGSNGLGGGLLVPNGNNVAFVPGAGGAGAGTFVQTLGNGITFQSDTTYTWELYIAMPKVVTAANDGGTNHEDNTSISAGIFVNNGGTGITAGLTINNQVNQVAPSTLLGSTLGVWDLVTLSVYVAPSSTAIGKSIDLEFGASMTSTDQPHQVDFDMIARPFTIGNQGEVPLPAALPLFAGGLGVLGLVARRRKQKNAAA